MSLFVLPGIVLAIPGGWLVDRFRTRLVLMLVGTGISGLEQAYAALAIGWLVAGLGATVLTIVVPR